MPAVEFQQVCKSFGWTTVLDRLSLAVRPGELAWLAGPSGSGKTTVLRLTAGLERPDSGRVLINGREASGDRDFLSPADRKVGMVFQDFALWPHLCVEKHLALVLGGRGLARGERRDRIAAMLDLVELGDRRRRHPHELSGGEQQRVAIARALVLAPPILLLDEPFAHLDQRLRERILAEVLSRRDRERAAVIIATHNPAEVEAVADRVVLMAGRGAHGGDCPPSSAG